MLYYPADMFGTISAHTDFEVFTLLHQKSQGLQFEVDGKYKWAPVMKDNMTFICIPGDVLEFWTNGMIKATKHRVQSCGKVRHSLILFYAADDDEDISPQKTFMKKRKSHCSSYKAARKRAKARKLTQGRHITQRVEDAENNFETLIGF